ASRSATRNWNSSGSRVRDFMAIGTTQSNQGISKTLIGKVNFSPCLGGWAVGGPQKSQCCTPRCRAVNTFVCYTLGKESKEPHSRPNGSCTGRLQAGRLALALESSA